MVGYNATKNLISYQSENINSAIETKFKSFLRTNGYVWCEIETFPLTSICENSFYRYFSKTDLRENALIKTNFLASHFNLTKSRFFIFTKRKKSSSKPC